MANDVHSGETQYICVRNGVIYVNNKYAGFPPSKRKGVNLSQINGKTYCNGFELKNGKWKRSIVAIIHDLF